ncbi:MAG: redoxin domain-containing protein [Lacipirellulaceae bacterium]
MFRTLPLLLVALAPLCHAEPIAVGADAPTMALESIDGGESIDLAATYKSGKTVVVFLRGYPGYQCPACSAQVADYRAKAADFADAGLRVVLVYPGGADGLEGHAGELTAGAALPEPLALVLDPDYAMTNAYGLRWDAAAETAYPTTLVVDGGKVAWIEVSDSHGGRVKAAKALRAATRE